MKISKTQGFTNSKNIRLSCEFVYILLFFAPMAKLSERHNVSMLVVYFIVINFIGTKACRWVWSLELSVTSIEPFNRLSAISIN